VVAINNSFVISGPRFNGESLMTLGTDWMSLRQGPGFAGTNVRGYLNVAVAGNIEDDGTVTYGTPSDQYNGITVGGTRLNGSFGYDQVSTGSFTPRIGDGRRSLVDLVAPGEDVLVGNVGNKPLLEEGTSFATPQVTGAIALIAQYAALRNMPDALNPLVQKAALLNSTDVLQDSGDGLRLGMTKTVLSKSGQSWLNSIANDDGGSGHVPLDPDFGTGALDVRRAVQQLSSGKISPMRTATGTPIQVPAVGWDLNTLTPTGQSNTRVYRLGPLVSNSWIDITLTWDRLVDLNDRNGNGLYDPGETFTPRSLSHLGIELVDVTRGNVVEAQSMSQVDNLQHIFYKLSSFNNDVYEIRIVNAGGSNLAAPVQYGLAWWADPAKPPPGKTITGMTFGDSNADGVRQPNEPAIPWVGVTLYDSNGVPIGSTVSDDHGQYAFYDVPAGTYVVVFSDHLGYTLTTQDAGADDSVDSDPDPGTGLTDPFQVSSSDVLHVDAGLLELPTGSVSGRVWSDLNGNGIQDAGEPGRADVEVDLYTSDGTFIDSAMTDAQGLYAFGSTAPGSYYVQLPQLLNYQITARGAGSGSSDSDVDPATGQSDLLVVDSAHPASVDAGFAPVTCSVTGRLWSDPDDNGIFEITDSGFDGRLVVLLDSTGAEVASTLTTGGGGYRFTGLAPGAYTLLFPQPLAGWQYLAGGPSQSVVVTAGIDTLAADARVYTPPEVIGQVWLDSDADGVREAGESGAPGTTVVIRDEAGNTITSSGLYSDGSFDFLGVTLAPGTYQLTVVPPAGYVSTTGLNLTTPFSVGDDGRANIEVGIFHPQALISSRVFFDYNGDGLGGDGPYPGVEVDLLDGTTGETLWTAITDDNGVYALPVLSAGSYQLQFLPPTGSLITTRHVPNPAGPLNNSDPDPNTGLTDVFTLAAGQGSSAHGAGMYVAAVVGGRVWADTNGNGIQDDGEPGLPGVAVTVSIGQQIVATGVTNADGEYWFNRVPIGLGLVQFQLPAGYVFTAQHVGSDYTIDSDANQVTGWTGTFYLFSGQDEANIDAGAVVAASVDGVAWADEDGNGVLSPGEPRLAGVYANLFTADGVWRAMALTGSDGTYHFPNLPPGDYKIIFTTPDGYGFTAQGTTPGVNSIPDPVSGQTPVFTLNQGDTLTGIDAGFVTVPTLSPGEPGGVGDLVWLDENGNGVQDAGEPGFQGMVVYLSHAPGGQYFRSTVTDVSGHFEFTDLDPGSYVIYFSQPTGFQFTPPHAGDSEADSDAYGSGVTEVFEVTGGSMRTDIDAGLIVSPPPTVPPVYSSWTGTIGDRVWVDLNANGVQDSGEYGAGGVTVILQDVSGNPIRATYTDGNGNYQFVGLAPGMYRLQFSLPPTYAGAVFTLQYQGSSQFDSDADTGGTTGFFALGANQEDDGRDAGIHGILFSQPGPDGQLYLPPGWTVWQQPVWDPPDPLHPVVVAPSSGGSDNDF
jgi:protocatechuate 3,4-dioxygenase beta subunit